MEGQNCGIGVLGIASELSSGGVNLVKPIELQRQMRQIIDNSIIAMGVSVCMVLFSNHAVTPTHIHELSQHSLINHINHIRIRRYPPAHKSSQKCMHKFNNPPLNRGKVVFSNERVSKGV